MARNEEAPAVSEAATEAAAAPATADSRFITLTLDQQAVTDLGGDRVVGSTMARKDYILSRWGQKIGRGPISKELSRLQGKEVPYQIVFQATGKIPGGPDKVAPVVAEVPAALAAQTPASE